MAEIVIMPRQGQSVESCIITSFAVKLGDTVAPGDTLFSYETDKSAFDEVSTLAGTVLAILKEDGEDVPCLEPVLIIGAAGEDISALLPKEEAAAAPAEEAASAAAVEAAPAKAEAAPTATAAPAEGGRVKISPRAKNLAIKTNADLYEVVPTGPNGRIIERDVQALLDAGKTTAPATLADFFAGKARAVEAVAEEAPAAVAAAPSATDFTAYREEKLPNVRRVIAKSMHQSLSEMAQLTLNASFDATALFAFRAKLKANGEALGMNNITLNDMILYAVSRVITSHPDLNAHYLGETMRFFSHVNLGIAVDTDRGLLVPTLFGADTLSLNELSAAAKGLIGDAKGGSIAPDLLKDATFTVTNLGSLGVESFTPVINPPQTAILGVCAAVDRVRPGKDGTLTTYKSMGLSLTFDHRALDGAPAARFLSALCKALENFDLLLAK